jgi:pimeloyl-ACP methyl ester carboxylesterase
MKKVTSADGTAIAFDESGDGPPVILVGGATCDRAMTRPLAEQLTGRFTVLNFDRRGRGDSGDTAPYAIERELEDLGALIAAAGGTASVYGHSSGAGLALHAAARGLPIDKLVLHDPPYNPEDEEQKRVAREYAERLRAALAEDRRGDALELFFALVGMPQEMIDGLRQSPRWAELEALAHTLAYDSEVMGDMSTGGSIPSDLVTRVTPDALVLVGEHSPEFMIGIARRIAQAMPHGRLRLLAGEEHVVAPELLAPVLADFLSEG